MNQAAREILKLVYRRASATDPELAATASNCDRRVTPPGLNN
jgi:hypothetical protein